MRDFWPMTAACPLPRQTVKPDMRTSPSGFRRAFLCDAFTGKQVQGIEDAMTVAPLHLAAPSPFPKYSRRFPSSHSVPADLQKNIVRDCNYFLYFDSVICYPHSQFPAVAGNGKIIIRFKGKKGLNEKPAQLFHCHFRHSGNQRWQSPQMYGSPSETALCGQSRQPLHPAADRHRGGV